ncbi:MAG: phosphatase PAP2 family protein [Oscillospiraceae bacterium]|nr:phosphatase PAP2 family protein [Oscillospiraceae bacterium]
MNKKSVLSVPMTCFWTVVAVCVLGIVVGSLTDFPINEALANKTSLGSFFATYGSYFSYCLYPAAGACLYAGLREKGEKYRMLARTLLILGFFMAVYYSNSYNGKAVRALTGYKAGESAPALSAVSWLFWVVLYAWVPFVMLKLLDRSNPEKLIAVGAAILVAGIAADNVNLWLKQVASRPRYKYLITLDDPISEFRNWWQMRPNLAGSDDNFKSWPSGNMTIAAMMFSLPMLADVTKKRNDGKNLRCFLVACVFVLLYGYNRIHMTNHFLSDVCFGTLITYLIFAAVGTAFLRAAEKM